MGAVVQQVLSKSLFEDFADSLAVAFEPEHCCKKDLIDLFAVVVVLNHSGEQAEDYSPIDLWGFEQAL